MATRSKKKKRFRAAWIVRTLIVILCAAVILTGVVLVRQFVVFLSPAEVYLKDLPEAFEGMRIVYAQDFLADSLRSPDAYRSLFRQIAALEPDMILLGGGYARDPKDDQTLLSLFSALDELKAPLGKFAILNESDDPNWAAGYFSLGGFTLLSDDAVVIEKSGEHIRICGSAPESAQLRDFGEIAEQVRDEDCAIFVSPASDAFPSINTQTAKGGGMIADLVLSGESATGDASLRYGKGQYLESGTIMLVSGGLGEKDRHLRLFSLPQIHLLTLKRPIISFSKDSTD